MDRRHRWQETYRSKVRNRVYYRCRVCGKRARTILDAMEEWRRVMHKWGEMVSGLTSVHLGIWDRLKKYEEARP